MSIRFINHVQLDFSVGLKRVDLVLVTSCRIAPAPSHLAFAAQNLPGFLAKWLAAVFQLDEPRSQGGHVRFYVNDPAVITL